jgi:hypothetical protein
MKEQHGVVGELPESDILVYLCIVYCRKFAKTFVQLNAKYNVHPVHHSVHMSVDQFANGLEGKGANLK